MRVRAGVAGLPLVQRQRSRDWSRAPPAKTMRAVIALPFAWLIVFFLLPFVLVLAIALGTNTPDSAPPVELGINFESFRLLFTDNLYLAAWTSSLRIAATSTLGALLL